MKDWGPGLSSRTGYKVMRCFRMRHSQAPLQDHVSPSIARSIVPPIKSRAVLAVVKAWPGSDAPVLHQRGAGQP